MLASFIAFRTCEAEISSEKDVAEESCSVHGSQKQNEIERQRKMRGGERKRE